MTSDTTKAALAEARQALQGLLANIRRDAPQLSGKNMGYAENAIESIDAALLRANAAVVPEEVEELRSAAKLLHNLTLGDATVIVRAPSPEKRDAIADAGRRLRDALGGTPLPKAQNQDAITAKLALAIEKVRSNADLTYVRLTLDEAEAIAVAISAAPSAPLLAEADDEDDGDLNGVAGPLPEHGWDEVPAAKSPTYGMTLAQRILHVGGRNNAAGYVEFGSTQAVDALIGHVLRDLPAHQSPAQGVVPTLRSALNAMLTFFGMDEDENSKAVFDLAQGWAQQPVQGGGDALEKALSDFEQRERGVPQAHMAAKLVAELRAALALPPAQPAPQTSKERDAGAWTEELTTAWSSLALDALGCLANVDAGRASAAECLSELRPRVGANQEASRLALVKARAQPAPQAQGDEALKALYVGWHGHDGGWLGIQGSYFISGVQAARASLPTSGVPAEWREFVENLAEQRSEPLNSVGGVAVVRNKARDLLAAAPQPAAARVGLGQSQINSGYFERSAPFTSDTARAFTFGVRYAESAHGIASPQEDGGTAA